MHEEDFSSESVESFSILNDPVDALCEEDRAQYLALRQSFNTSMTHDRHTATFQQEISRIIHFVDACPERREQRALAAGLIYTGSYFCVNTQQLRRLICRCKSSINNGFQQLGFGSLKMKAKAQSCLLSALPCLMNDTLSIRQWTVRGSFGPAAMYGLNRMHVSMSMTPMSPVPHLPPVVPHQTATPPLPLPIIATRLTGAGSAPVKKTLAEVQKPAISDEDDAFWLGRDDDGFGDPFSLWS